LNITNNCQYIKKGPNSIILYGTSLNTIDGIIKYDCGEGQKVFNGKEFHPTNKEEILDKQVIDLFLLSYTEKDCLKKGKKFSDDDYQLCWCEEIKLSAGGSIVDQKLYHIKNFSKKNLFSNIQVFEKHKNKKI